MSTMYTCPKNYNTYTDHNLNLYKKNPDRFRLNDELSQDLNTNPIDNTYTDCNRELNNTLENFQNAFIQTNYDPDEFNDLKEKQNNTIDLKEESCTDKAPNKKLTDKSTIDNKIEIFKENSEKKNEIILDNQQEKEKHQNLEVQGEEDNDDEEDSISSKSISDLNGLNSNCSKDSNEVEVIENNIFKVIYPKKDEIPEKEDITVKKQKYDFYFNKNKDIKRTRFLQRRRRLENQDNIRKKLNVDSLIIIYIIKLIIF